MPALSRSLTRRIGAVVAVGGAAAILAATLSPSPGQAVAAAATPLLCVICGEVGGTDAFLNLLLFAPMAVGLRLLGWPWRRVVAAAALLSLTVESLQFAVIPGRDASLSDLLTNTTGAAVAAAMAPYLPRLALPAPALARRLLTCAAALFVIGLALSALALQPSVGPGRLRSDCLPYSPALGSWNGTLHSITLDGVALPCDRGVVHGEATRAAMTGGKTALRIEAVSGAPTRRRAAVHTIRAGREPAVTLVQDGSYAVFSVPSVSRRLRLFPITLQLSGAFPAGAGIPFELQGGRDGPRVWIASSYSGRQRSAEITLSPSLGWTSLLWYRYRPGPRLRALTAIWLAVLILPAGYWVRFVRRPAWGLGGIVAALVAGLGLLPALTGFPPAHWSEWLGASLGAALGAALGWALQRLAAYLPSRCGSPSTSAYSSS